MIKTIGWSCYETIALPFLNFNFGGRGVKMAQNLVKEGKMRWACCHGNTLTLVENNYELQMYEYFVKQTSNGFQIVE